MAQKDLETWEEFEAEVKKLITSLSAQKKHGHASVAKPLFRGQSIASWSLKTSLERYLSNVVSIKQYNLYLLRIKPAIETYTSRLWTVEKNIVISETNFQSAQNYAFMLYLRHHGFPSPLLDWSRSPYVALFFAFQKAAPEERVAIFTYVGDLGHGKAGLVGEPAITTQGPYVSSHRRHFMQQSQYTIATEKVKEEWTYCSHENIFSRGCNEDQDLLIKFTLPSSLRNESLQKLHQMNINAFTLYGTDESLMDMLAFQEIIAIDMHVK